MGLFSFIGSLLGAGSEKSAVRDATGAQVDAFNKGINEESRQYDTSRADFMPYMQAGTSALPGILDLLGLNGPDAAGKAIAALKSSPVFTSLYNTGKESVLQNASATGGLRGGNTDAALYDLGTTTLSSVISDQLSRLGGLAGLGEGATGSVAGLGADKANAVAALLSKIGGAQASGDLAIGGINNSMWNSAGGFLDSLVSSVLPGGFGSILSGLGGGGGAGGISFTGGSGYTGSAFGGI